MKPSLAKQWTAEFVGTFALCFVGIGAIYNNPGLLGVALAHGLTIAVMVSATGAISGGHLNPAVSFGLFVSGHLDFKKLLAYWSAQLSGATVAGLLCSALLGTAAVANGTPDVGVVNGTPVVTFTQALIIEAVLTFFLVFVVFGTAVDARAPKIGGLAIGLTVALDILFGGPLTGAAMNPARTFGPALASGHWNNHLIYWLGPLLGGALAGWVYGHFLIKQDR
ncbi:MAG: aquaporin [Verrucomicrobia bacterium]|nr:MAG: aquaporin [Verrucomicrobiota bacterium]